MAVVLLHILPYPKGIYHGEWQLFFISLDQLARFCVPAFLFVSAYGLACKHQDKPINYHHFITGRVMKLLPLYIMWSLTSILIVSSVPAWSFGGQPSSICVQLLLGQADYQLYFIIVLLQLYLLFPLIWKFKRYINFILLVTLFIQLCVYYFYSQEINHTERFEYVSALSWIFYFVLGIYVKMCGLTKPLIKAAPWLAALAFAAVVGDSYWHIKHGLDPLPALKFTRLLVIPFAVFSIFTLAINNKLDHNLIAHLGKQSYLIFLAHTIGLRILHAIYHQQLEWWLLGQVVAMWLGTIAVSIWLMKHAQHLDRASRGNVRSGDGGRAPAAFCKCKKTGFEI